MKADLHVHSRCSKRPSQWILQKLECPESFTEPQEIYRKAKQKGMDLVTITDHNTLDGALEIAHLAGTFVSEEITAYFPQDGCKVHVLAYDISEAQHRDIQKARENIHDLAAYLSAAGIFHAVAHPLYAVNDRLTAEHVEKLLLLFQTFEMNGARNEVQNQVLRDLLRTLTPTAIDRLENLHGMNALHRKAWEKNLIGGSDDHSSINIGRKFTSVPDTDDASAFLTALDHGRGTVFGRPSTPQTMAHNLYGIAYQYYRNKLGLDRYLGRDGTLRFLDRVLSGRPVAEKPSWAARLLFFHGGTGLRSKNEPPPDNIKEIFLGEARKLLATDPELQTIVRDRNTDRTGEACWYRFVSRISNQVLVTSSRHLLDQLAGGQLFNVFSAIGSAGALAGVLAPYFLAYDQFTRDRALTDEILGRFPAVPSASRNPHTKPPRIAHFTDTLREINGVALTLQQQIKNAVGTGKDLTLITCDQDSGEPWEGVTNFAPAGEYQLPEYPDLKLRIPPFLEMLRYCYEEDFTIIHSATPGPVGLAALAIARILHRPIRGTYHTSLPQYAGQLTGDPSLEQLTWKLVLWYYNQMETIYVPSRATGDELIKQGVAPERIQVYPRGVDLEQFHPDQRSSRLTADPALKNRLKLLYVGRVSREKDLETLVEAFRRIHDRCPDTALVVVGEGPFLAEMKQQLHDLPCVFTGVLRGDELAGVYADCDLFVFPSTTDTFGNVVLEAQASGLPAIVSDQGGPQENVLPGKSGLVVPAKDAAGLSAAIVGLIRDPLRLQAMKRQARQSVEQRSFDKTFEATWKLFIGDAAEPVPALSQAV